MASSAKPDPVPVSADDLRGRVRARYATNGCVVLEEVRNAGGFNASRAVDMLAMETWPSKGYVTRAFEIKVTRSDWLRERADPSKAEAFAAMVDEFWIVSPPGVALVEELPAGYGLFHSAGAQRLKLMRQAATRVGQRAPIDRALVAAMLVRSQDAKRVERLIADARKEERAMIEPRIQHLVERRAGDATGLQASVAAFEARSGVRIGSYDGGRIGDAVRVVRDGKLPQLAREAKFAHGRLAEVVEQLGEAARALSDAAGMEEGGKDA